LVLHEGRKIFPSTRANGLPDVRLETLDCFSSIG
jgi:hypothetical protein